MGWEAKNVSPRERLDRLYVQKYRKGSENHVTEALFKWFYFSGEQTQEAFLNRICGVPRMRVQWTKIELQRKGGAAVPDARLTLADGSRLLFEIKISEGSLHRNQLRNHLKSLTSTQREKLPQPALVVITPHKKLPPKVVEVNREVNGVIKWVSWRRVVEFTAVKIGKKEKSRDQLLRSALSSFLRKYLKGA